MIIERLEQFKDYQKKLKMQDIIIREKKEILVRACQTEVPETLRQELYEKVEEAERKKTEIILDEMRERHELEEDIPEGRFGTAEEVARAVWMLVSGPAYMTGQVINMDGGYI